MTCLSKIYVKLKQLLNGTQKKRLIPRDMEIEQARIPQKQRTTGGNFF